MIGRGRTRRELGRFFGLALGSTAVLHGAIACLGLPFSLAPDSPAFYLYLLGLATPAVAALAVSKASERRRFLRQALRPRGSLIVHGCAVLAQAGLLGAAWSLSLLDDPPARLRPSVASGFWLLALGQVWVVVGEELGWRAFALPRLERLLSPRGATLLLALAWGAWHAPMFFVAGSLQGQDPVWLFAAAIFAWSCMHTALYHHARPSIVPNLLFHASANVTLNLVAIPASARLELALAYLAVGCTVWLLLGRSRRSGQAAA